MKIVGHGNRDHIKEQRRTTKTIKAVLVNGSQTETHFDGRVHPACFNREPHPPMTHPLMDEVFREPSYRKFSIHPNKYNHSFNGKKGISNFKVALSRNSGQTCCMTDLDITRSKVATRTLHFFQPHCEAVGV